MIINYLINKIKYSKFHYLLLKFKNPNYINYLNSELNFYKKLLSKNILIFDLGANMGDKTYIFSFFSRKIICYEPEKKFFLILKNRFKNKYVKIENKIVSNKKKKVFFYSVLNDEAYSTIFKNTLKSFNHLKGRKIYKKNIISTTLNSEILKYGIPDYIKIDCEGAEKVILNKLKYRVNIISFESNLPQSYKDTCYIINYLHQNFNSKFNLRRQNISHTKNNFEFFFEKNIDYKSCIKFIKNKKETFEIFSFS
jgi:FkbM family methyltransferase